MKQTLSILKNGMEGKLSLVESISQSITYNARLHNFLSEPFENQNGSMDEYFQFINPIVFYSLQYNQVDIRSIKVYMNNYSIPEGFGSFYHDTIVQGRKWYDSFIKSDKRSIWISLPEEGSYDYLQKLVSLEGEFLGVTRVTILKQNLLTTLDESSVDGSGVYVMEAGQHLIYSSEEDFHSSVTEMDSLIDKQFEQNGKLYVQEHINRLAITVGMTKSLPRSLHSYQLLTTAAFITAIILSIFLFYQLLKKTFVKIKGSIRAMDYSIRTGFIEKIPVERNDEIGVISEKFNTLLDQINTLVNDMIKRETVHKDAQLRALQAQINPHFIYNTINLFSAKTELAGLYDVSDAFADFGQMLRYNMNDQSEYVTIQEEINHVINYIQLQKLKYTENLKLDWTCSPQLINRQIIRFILQPVVENSIIHGMAGRKELAISLDVKWNDLGEIVIIITDNGAGVPAERLLELNRFFQRGQDDIHPLLHLGMGTGIALGNINERLRLFYGNQSAIRMESVEGSYTRTEITVPCQKEEEDFSDAKSLNC
ncbi:sensor histidine kinase [Paenibacillus luteus]|uniref:sensor histidine kinase n=1 Tax=Paenibacillus luteus TaxID=2545753 RepID=UPI0013762588|nr:histidine kinase [Paenibacillus luteus]